MELAPSPSGRKYGWIRQEEDQRDFLLALPIASHLDLPAIVDMRPEFPPVYDQGQLGSCTANAMSAAFAYEHHREHRGAFITPSRLAFYYDERLAMNSVEEDSGATIRVSAQTAAKVGFAHEKLWPYDIAKFTQAPTSRVETDASKHRATKYEAVHQSEIAMRTALAIGRPIVIGFTVYESFESGAVASNGVVPMPESGEKVLGGHAVVVVGYNHDEKRFIVRNSWGDGWGDHGYFHMPYAFLTDPSLASDFWTLSVVA